MPSPSPSRLAAELECALRAAGTPERAAQERRYLKSSLEHVGASVPAIRKAAVALHRATPDLDRRALLALVDALWARGIHECRMAAVELLDLYADRLGARDLGGTVERLLRDARTWALVDGLAATVAGALVDRFPESEERLDAWARDDDLWIRRAALLAHLVALREGRGDFERFGRYADAMLGEKELFIRKAIGWVLRDASRSDPAPVARWLLPRAARASGLTLREATKYLTAPQRAAVLAAARATSTGRAPPRGRGGRAAGERRRPATR